jgi:hypothetical protein
MTLRRWSLLLALLMPLAAIGWAEPVAENPDAPEADVPPAEAEGPDAAETDEKPLKETYRLAGRIVPGQWVLHQDYQSESYAMVDGVGQPIQKMQINARMPMVIAEQAGQTHLAVVTVDRLALDVSVGQAELSYDSARQAGPDQSEMLQKLLQPLVDAKLRFQVTPAGQIRDLQGRNKVLEEMSEADKTVKPMFEGLEKFFGDFAGRSGGSAQTLLPEDPVEIGQEWDVSLTRQVDLLGKVTMHYTCQLVGVDNLPAGQMATITFVESARDEKGGGKIEMAGASVWIDSFQIVEPSGSTPAGRFRLNLDTGQVTEYQVRQTIKAKITVVDQLNVEKKVSLSRQNSILWRITPPEEETD